MNMSTLIIAGVALVLLIIVSVTVLKMIYTVPSNKALIVSGSVSKDGKPRIIPPGGRAVVIPVINFSNEIDLSQHRISIDLKNIVDSNSVDLNVKATAIVKIGTSNELLRAASERYSIKSNQQTQNEIVENTKDVLYGSLRSIVAEMTITELLRDRSTLQLKVYEQAEKDLNSMGLIIDSLQINEITDDNGYIESLGVPEKEKALKDASIAKSRNKNEANRARVEAEKEIEEQNKELSVRQAELIMETDKAKAEADSIYSLTKAEQDKKIAELSKATAIANAELKEKQLDTEVRRPADAERYKTETEAEASKNKRIFEAEAEARETELQAKAEATKTITNAEAESQSVTLKAKAEAQSVTLKAEAESQSVTLKGQAEAEAIEKIGVAESKTMKLKADSYSELDVIKLASQVMPEIARELSAPMSNIKDMTVISNDGASALTKNLMNNFSQLNALAKNFGIDLTQIIEKTNHKEIENNNTKNQKED